MRKLSLLLFVCINMHTQAQNNVTANIIEGGKTLVDLIRVIKTPKIQASSVSTTASTHLDSCSIKGIADISYKNNFGKSITISLYKRNGTTYSVIPLTLKIATGMQESLFEIAVGIYKYKIETEEEEIRKLHSEGELKIQACDKMIKEIKKE